jgi:oligopeptide/dipeptide ABC transporter ATP-binding protein
MTDRAAKDTPEPLLDIKDLRKIFSRRRGLPFFGRTEEVRAVDGVDLRIGRGQTLGLVGESGSGKSTLGRVLLDLVPRTSGSVRFEGKEVKGAIGEDAKSLRRRMQIVFQDPYASLNPRMLVGESVREGLRAGGMTDSAEIEKRLRELIEAVGLSPAHIGVFPHRLSGGQRQRVAIARALSVNPSFIVADEPVSALDLSIQAQILNLLADLQAQFGLTYLLISHDLNVIRYLADCVAVMYRGRIVEEAPAEQLFANPRHPYTQLLFSALPKIDHRGKRVARGASSTEPSRGPIPEKGCSFYPRCPMGQPRCLESEPQLTPANATHRAACFLAEVPAGAAG